MRATSSIPAQLFLAVLTFILILHGVAAAQCADYGGRVFGNPGVRPVTGITRSVVAQDDLLYLATRDGLAVLDATDPTAPAEIGSVPVSGIPVVACVEGSRVFVGTETAGVAIVDVSNPLSPAMVGSVALPGTIGDVVVSGELVFVADRDNGLHVIQAPVAGTPEILVSLTETGGIRAIAHQDDLLYVTGNGLQIVDVSDPSMPSVIGYTSVPQKPSQDVVVSEGWAYVSDGSSGLYAIDVSDPTSPRRRGDLPLAYYYVLELVGTRLYCSGVKSMQVVDVSIPGSLRLVEWYDEIEVGVGSFAVTDGYIYSVTGQESLWIAEVDGAVPVVPYTRWPDVGNVLGIGAGPECMFASMTQRDGRAVLASFSGQDPVELDRVILGPDHPAHDIVVVGDRVIAARLPGFNILDCSDPSNLVGLGAYVLTGLYITALEANETHAFLCREEGEIQVWDISDPSAAHQVHAFSPPSGRIWDYELVGGYLYATTQSLGMHLIDVRDPLQPVFVDRIIPDRRTLDITTDGMRIVVSGSMEGPVILDVRDPANPVVLSDSSGIRGAPYTIAGEQLYGGGWAPSLKLIDISDPTTPVTVARTFGFHESFVPVDYDHTYELGNFDQVIYFADKYGLYMTPMQCGLTVPILVESFTAVQTPEGVRVSWTSPAEVDPRSLVLRATGSSGTRTLAFREEATGEYVMIDRELGRPGETRTYQLTELDPSGGVFVLAEVSLVLDRGVAPSLLLGAGPNPFRSSLTIRLAPVVSREVSIDVYDLRGRHVRALEVGPQSVGTVTWDGRDGKGRSVASGAYLVVARSEQGRETLRVVHMR